MSIAVTQDKFVTRETVSEMMKSRWLTNLVDM